MDVVLASATDCSSIPGAREETFDLALCNYVLCNLSSKEEVLLLETLVSFLVSWCASTSTELHVCTGEAGACRVLPDVEGWWQAHDRGNA